MIGNAIARTISALREPDSGEDPGRLPIDDIRPRRLFTRRIPASSNWCSSSTRRPLIRRTAQGGTALRAAADSGHIEVVRYLLERGAMPRTRTRPRRCQPTTARAPCVSRCARLPSNRFRARGRRQGRRRLLRTRSRHEASRSAVHRSLPCSSARFARSTDARSG